MKNTIIPTGFEQLDKILNGGFKKSDLVILAARPAMGKSSLALNIMQNIAQNQNEIITMFSLEMSKEKVLQRLVLQNKAEKNLNKILSLPIHIDDTVDNTVDKIIVNLSKSSVGLIVIDFLELIPQTSQIEEIINKLKHLALELDTPILCLSQLPRTIDEKNNKRPDLNDLIYKETVLANADSILLLYRDSYYYPTKKEESKSIAEIIVYQKHNYNESSVAKLAFDANIGKFENISD